jgi:hypothetical protein
MSDLLERKGSLLQGWPEAEVLAGCSQELPPLASEAKELYRQTWLKSTDYTVPNIGRTVHQSIDEWEEVEDWRVFVAVFYDHVFRDATSHLVSFLFKVDAKEPAPAPISRPPVKEDFLDRARRLEDHSRLNSALDVVYNHVDEMLLAGMFSELDDRIASIECDKYSADLLLAMLTITHAAKSRLPRRKDFYDRVEESIRRRGELEEGMLFGLD